MSSFNRFSSLSPFKGRVIVDGEEFFDADDYLLADPVGGKTRFQVAAAPPLPYVPPKVKAKALAVPELCRNDKHETYYLSSVRPFGTKTNSALTIIPSSDGGKYSWAVIPEKVVREIKANAVAEYLAGEQKKKDRRLGTISPSTSTQS